MLSLLISCHDHQCCFHAHNWRSFCFLLLPKTSSTPETNSIQHTQEWEVLAEDSLDAVLEPEDEIPSEPDVPSGASITWRGDGKYFATVSAPEGKPFSWEPQPEEYKHISSLTPLMQALLHQSEAALTCALCSKGYSLVKLTQLYACLHAAPCIVIACLNLKTYIAFLYLPHWYN